ncbi:MAG: ABC transporter ATP-binding protein, partial [Methylobacteriaceae bacterium]|nr:ABC transporter ATP-binding protein [Methylobacteriaceae bacterium]
MFRRFESLIDPFSRFDETEMPPDTVGRFSWHYLRPIRGWLMALFAVSVVVGVIESGLYVLIGWFVDLLAHASPDRLLAEHGTKLAAAAALVLVARPVFATLHEFVANQIIVPQTTTMIRWRTHTYTLGHALSYFQADFAGRLANRITQAGPSIREIAVTLLDTLTYVGIFAFAALGLFGSISLWLALPMALWIGGYVLLLRYFVPRAQVRSLANAEARSVTVGRIVDSYT